MPECADFLYLHCMKNLLYTTGLGILLSACGGESDVVNTTTDTTQTDTTAVAVPNIDIDESALLAKYTGVSLPFAQDSAYLDDMAMAESSKLTADEVRYLSYNFLENDMSYSGKSTIDDVLFFDSLKTNDAYEEYLEILELGMMKDANAFAAQKIALDDSTELLLWYVDFGTYEACPYFAGKNLYASVFRNNAVRSATLVGENSGGGDAPYWSSTLTLFSVENGKMQAVKKDLNGGDTDEEGNDIVSESVITYSLEIINGNWQVTEQQTPVE
jgi:hypothetical protein